MAVTSVAEEEEGEEVRVEGEFAREEEGEREEGTLAREEVEVRAAANKLSLGCHAREDTVVVSLHGAEVSFL